MKGEEDPFIKVLDFLDAKTPQSQDFGLKIAEFFDSIIYSIFMVIFLVAAAAVLIILATPLLLSSQNAVLLGTGAIIQVFMGVTNSCHQLPYRSFIINGIPQPICARDVGIYVGAILGFSAILWKKTPKIMNEKKSLLIAFAPIILDGASQTIWNLRESNNIIRLATGFLFTFFLIGFLTQRFFSPRYPGFRRKALDWKFLASDFIVLGVLLYAATPVAYEFGSTYMSRDEAVQKALESSTITSPVKVESYYIAPNAPFSLNSDPFRQNHDDILLKDLSTMLWYNMTACEASNSCYQEHNPFNESSTPSIESILNDFSEKRHNLGLWAVAVLQEEPSGTSDPYISSGRGEYYYFDAYGHQLIAKENH